MWLMVGGVTTSAVTVRELKIQSYICAGCNLALSVQSSDFIQPITNSSTGVPGVLAGYPGRCQKGDATSSRSAAIDLHGKLAQCPAGRTIDLPYVLYYPDENAAYQAPNQYTFARELLVAPITQPADANTKLARHSIWLPAGQWYDFFTDEAYEGGKWLTIHAEQSQIPVFARAGAIIPMDEEIRSNEESSFHPFT